MGLGIPAAAAFYLLFSSSLSLVVVFYRLQRHGVTLSFTDWPTWLAVIIPVSLLALSSVSLLSHYQHSRRNSSKHMYLHLVAAMGCVAFTLSIVGAEVMLRLLAEEYPEGPLIGNTLLLPRDWSKVVAHRRISWEQAARGYGVFTEDDTLGWTVGRNRKGVGPYNETYLSNDDGLRTLRNGASIRDRAVEVRIAIVGDSYTFGEDVSYEETWGHHLEHLMGPGVQVLNFGVPAYGIDQAYLRYLRDVRAWHPDIVILSFISHDLIRTGLLYYWIGFQGAAVPGAKPRFFLDGEQLKLLNLPLPSPESIGSTARIGDLPFVQFDTAYNARDWEPHLYQYSYLLRFAVSWPFDLGSSLYRLDRDVQKINEAILNSFVHTVRQAGSYPMVVFLPEYMEFQRSSGRVSERDLLGKRVAQEAGIELVDLTPCVETVPGSHRFTPGWHYTPQVNGAVARCLQSWIVESPAAIPRRQALSGK